MTQAAHHFADNGGSKRRRKLGEVVAERIVDEIIRRGWREGDMLGTEADLMTRFQISRATFREAVRQLEWHGAAGMRRGASGGLVVRAPPRHAVVYALKTYFELSQLPRAQLDRCRGILAAAPKLHPTPKSNQPIALFLEALDRRTLADLGRERSVSSTIKPKLSETVALRLVHDIERAGVKPGTNLGNESTLQERYNVSRAVLREALRPLELHDIVRVKTGAQGGIIIHQCDPGYTVDLACTYLTFARIPLSHVWEAQSWLQISAVQQFVGRSNEIALARLRRGFERLQHASPDAYFAASIDFHQTIGEGSGNKALALFVSILLRYGRYALPAPSASFLPELKRQHLLMLQAIEAGKPRAARAIMRDLFEHSRRWIAHIERTPRKRGSSWNSA